MSTHFISPARLTIADIEAIISSKAKLALSPESKALIQKSRAYLESKLAGGSELFYGINTGFGSLCNIQISDEETEALQVNLIRSHACGVGDLVPHDVVRLILLLKIQSLSYGHSGVQPIVVDRLVDFYNADVLPVIYQLGSLGASGDLAPLAHVALPLIGEGEVFHKGTRMPAAEALTLEGWDRIALGAKDGIGMLNGTQFSLGYAVWCLINGNRLLRSANLAAALSMDGFNCRRSPFDARLHNIRPHQGQVSTAQTILEILEGSQFEDCEKHDVQDPYAFRCVPQVHGASSAALAHIQSIVETEMNSVTDNPNVFPDSDGIISGGNFHAQPLALPLDYLAIALAELGSISERRIYQLIGGKRDLPAFLTPHPGLHSGMMIAQYTAASIVSQNKQLATPASVDSIVSCNGQEDHVSMAANAATKAYKVVDNLERLLAIEWMIAAQALDFRRPLKSSNQLEKLHTAYRKKVTKLEEDRILSTDIHDTIEFIRAAL